MYGKRKGRERDQTKTMTYSHYNYIIVLLSTLLTTSVLLLLLFLIVRFTVTALLESIITFIAAHKLLN